MTSLRGRGEPRSGRNRHNFRMWAGLSKPRGSRHSEAAAVAVAGLGLGRGTQDGTAAWPARTAAHLLLPGGPRPVARCAGEQGEVLGGVAPLRRSGGPGRGKGREGASPPGIGLAGGLGWHRPTFPPPSGPGPCRCHLPSALYARPALCFLSKTHCKDD